MDNHFTCDGPVLSVVIPAYNSEKYISRTLTSLLRQNAEAASYEIIVVDDGSVDNTMAICEEFAKNNENIHVVHQENRGVSAARNHGIALARGRWITFVDSDDYVLPHYIHQVISVSSEADYVIFDHYLEEKGEKSPGKNWISGLGGQVCHLSQIMPWICDQRLNSPWDKRYNLEIIRENNVKFPEDMHMGEDLVFNFCYALHSVHAYICEQASYVYVDNSQGVTRRKVSPDRMGQLERAYDTLQQLCEENRLENICSEMLDRSFLRVAARTGGQLYRSGHSCRTIAQLFDRSEMMQCILSRRASSIKDFIRCFLLRNHLYQICSVVISER